LTSLAYLFITVIAASAVIRIDDDLDNALEQRNTCATKCPFILNNEIFDPDCPKNEKVSEGPIKGPVVFAQDEEAFTYTYDDMSLGCDNEKYFSDSSNNKSSKFGRVNVFLSIIENGNINSRAKLLLNK
ncbi:9285_t:CDS:2, partial [Funneliformis caledonium]